mgnify:CR=1 FL=1|tara:strand:- start:27238 stop:28239 length:1002 start_codon:yes stop_codon:yes gene_type:complete
MTTIIAEAGVNHNGEIELAKELIYAAKESGADIVKFQTFKTDNCISKSTPIVPYQSKGKKDLKTQYELVKDLELSFEEFIILKELSDKIGIEFLSTGFDIQSLDFLENLGIKRYKVPSGEITNLPYLRKISTFRKPVIMSTGMSNLDEIEKALSIFLEEGIKKNDLTILHCTTQYPTLVEDVNLNAMITIANKFDVKVGYSDHTQGVDIAVSAIAMGASVIEKHLTLDRNLIGPDHQASIEPSEFKKMTKLIRRCEDAKGSFKKEPTASEKNIINLVRKSIVAKKQIKKGDVFSENNLTVKRPGTGISPMKWDELIGKKANKNYLEEEFISWD